MKLKQKMFMKIYIKKKIFFDFGNFPENSKFFDLVNKKVIGKMEDEVKGKIIHEFVGLKSKCIL